jgi:AraC-like DNA-binding protein
MSKHWSTTDVPARQQFAYWREAVCEAVMNVATEAAADEDFSGNIACADFSGLRFATFRSSPHRIVRQPSHIGRSNNAHFLISLQRSGIGRMQQANQSCELKAGDIGIVDGARPFSVLFPQTVDRAVAVIPSAMLDHRAPWLRDHPIARMRHDPELHPMLRMTIERLAGPACQSIGEAELLADNLCNLVALLTAHNVSDQNAVRERLPDIERMNAFIKRHLSDPDLSPQTLAKYLNVSVRTVHNRFEAAETSFGRAVLDLRLDEAQRALSDPRQAQFSVTQIAYRIGFNDLSHFSKTFRAKFRIPPGRYRTTRVSALEG